MKNLLFFLWMLFAPIVEDIAEYIVYKTKGEKMKDGDCDSFSTWMFIITYIFVGYLLYDN